MLKSVALIGLAAALALPPAAALAVSGTSSSYGTEGIGPRIPTRSLSNWDRAWNHANQSKYQSEAGAEWMRRHHRSFPLPW
jgi:hypothetical protein